jgi:hypothetical protein
MGSNFQDFMTPRFVLVWRKWGVARSLGPASFETCWPPKWHVQTFPVSAFITSQEMEFKNQF